MKDKKYYFLVGLPRSGNTIFGSLLNQNPTIAVTANSIFPDILWKLYKEKETNLVFKNFPDHASYDNLLSGTFQSYYKDWSASTVIDRASWGTTNNLMLIDKYCPNKPKFIVLVRDVVEVLASFIKWSEENPINFINAETGNASIEDKCEFLMRPELQIVQEYCAIHNLFNDSSRETLFITYNQLVSDTQNQLERVYSFLDLPMYPHNLTKLSQFSTNNVEYYDLVVGENLHTVREDGLSKTQYSVEQYLPTSVIEKYSNLSFWNNERTMQVKI